MSSNFYNGFDGTAQKPTAASHDIETYVTILKKSNIDEMLFDFKHRQMKCFCRKTKLQKEQYKKHVEVDLSVDAWLFFA